MFTEVIRTMFSSMDPIDWYVVFFYLGAMLWLGYVFSKKQTTVRNYFLGGREMPWWAVGLSIIATETSALTVIGIPAMAYNGNLKFIQIVIGYILARIFITIIMIPKYFAGAEMYSPYELIERKFGGAAKTLAVYLIMIAGFLAAGVRVYVTAIPLKLLLGLPITWAIIIFGIIAIFYTYMGGISAVIWTDVAQFFMFVVGGIFAVFYIPTLIDGGFNRVISVCAEADKLAWLDLKFSLTGDFNIWMGVLGAAFLCSVTHGADQLLVQRILACKSEEDGKKAMMLSAAIILPIFLIFLFVGLMLFVYYKSNPFVIEPYHNGKFKADWLFPIFMITKMPIVIKGLLISAIFAAAMSSIDSALSALSSIFVMNVHKDYFAKDRDEEYYINFSKHTVFLFGIILIIVAFTCQNVELILNWAFKLSGITGGAVLGAMLLAILYKDEKKDQLPVILGMLVACAIMNYIAWNTKIHWSWYSITGTASCMLTAYLVTPFYSEFKTWCKGNKS